MIFRKIVIRGIPIEIPNEEIWGELKESNSNLVFDKDDIFKLRTRIYKDGVTSFVDSSAVKLIVSLKSSAVPSHAFM